MGIHSDRVGPYGGGSKLSCSAPNSGISVTASPVYVVGCVEVNCRVVEGLTDLPIIRHNIFFVEPGGDIRCIVLLVASYCSWRPDAPLVDHASSKAGYDLILGLHRHYDDVGESSHQLVVLLGVPIHCNDHVFVSNQRSHDVKGPPHDRCLGDNEGTEELVHTVFSHVHQEIKPLLFDLNQHVLGPPVVGPYSLTEASPDGVGLHGDLGCDATDGLHPGNLPKRHDRSEQVSESEGCVMNLLGGEHVGC